MIAIRKQIESLNKFKGHWSKRHKDSKAWECEIYAALNGKIRKATGKMSVKVTSVRKRALDSDNLIGGFKGGRDALKRLGLIIDDSPKFSDFSYAQKIQSVGGYTIIEIEPVVELPTDWGKVNGETF